MISLQKVAKTKLFKEPFTSGVITAKPPKCFGPKSMSLFGGKLSPFWGKCGSKEILHGWMADSTQSPHLRKFLTIKEIKTQTPNKSGRIAAVEYFD